MAGHLVPPGSVFAFLAEHRRELFPDSFTADLFPSRTGRPSLPADLVGAVLVLKELHDLSDPQTADALKSDIRWKVACGRSLDQMSFDPSTLVYWRKRIAASDRPDRVFDAVAEVVTQTGILRGRRKRCVDSTVSGDAVATQDTVTQLVAAVRKVARVVPGAGEVIAGRASWITRSPASRRSTGMTRRPGRIWSATWSATRWRCWRAGRARRAAAGRRAADALGPAGAGRWAGRGASRGQRWHGRAVAHRPQGRPGPGDQHRRSPGAAYPQVEVEAAGRVPRARGGRAGDRADH